MIGKLFLYQTNKCLNKHVSTEIKSAISVEEYRT